MILETNETSVKLRRTIDLREEKIIRERYKKIFLVLVIDFVYFWKYK